MKKTIFCFLTLVILVISVGCDDTPPTSDNAAFTVFGAVVADRNYPGNINGNNISIEVPYGTDVSDLQVWGEVPDFGDYRPLNNQDFSNGAVQYTVTAENGTTSTTYGVSVAVNENTDGTVLGIYKGILVGSSGYFTIDIRSENSVGTMFFEGKTYNLANSFQDVAPDAALDDFGLRASTERGEGIFLTVQANGSDPMASTTNIRESSNNGLVWASVQKESSDNSVSAYEGHEIERESQDGGNTYAEVERWTYNISMTDTEFTLLIEGDGNDGLIFREEGTVTKNGNSITIRSLRANDGNDTPLTDLDKIDQDDSERTFEIDGEQLISSDEPYVDADVTRQFSYELTKRL